MGETARETFEEVSLNIDDFVPGATRQKRVLPSDRPCAAAAVATDFIFVELMGIAIGHRELSFVGGARTAS
jgi:hypothetical protein